MKRGITNESKAMKCIRLLDFVLCCYENGMFGDKIYEWIEASPDGIGAIDTNALSLEISRDNLYKDIEISKNSNQFVNSKYVLLLTNLFKLTNAI